MRRFLLIMRIMKRHWLQLLCFSTNIYRQKCRFLYYFIEITINNFIADGSIPFKKDYMMDAVVFSPLSVF